MLIVRGTRFKGAGALEQLRGMWGREVKGGFRMVGHLFDSCQCMAKTTTIL